MLTVEEIKEGCIYAEGFEWGLNNPQDPYIRFTYGTDKDQVFLDGVNFKNVYYPLFLQRVIEGINEYSENILIDQGYMSIDTRIEQDNKPTIFESFSIQLGRYDQAKEQAIKYILGEINE